MLRSIDKLRSELVSSQFSLPEAAKYLDKCKYVTTVQHVGPNRDCTKPLVTCHVLSRTTNYVDVPPRLLLEKVVRRIVATIALFDIRKRFVFWLVPCPSNRSFPSRGQVMPKHINGGFTYVHSDMVSGDAEVVNGVTEVPEVNIYIYRLEEFPKVMLHETLHHSRIDTHQQWAISEIDALKKHYNIHHSTIFLPNEAIVEAWAVIMHTAFLAIEFHMPFDTLWQKELEWMRLQASRLIAYQYRGSSQHHPHRMWRETTNSYCYIVLKALLLERASEFVAFAVATNQNSSDIKAFVMKALLSSSPSSSPKDIFPWRTETAAATPKTMRMTVFGSL